MPHMVVSLVSSASDELVNQLLKEIAAIIDDEWDDPTAEEETTRNGDRPPEGEQGNTDHLVVAQALFAILDHVRAWVRAKYAALLEATGKPENQLKAEDMRKVSRNREYCRLRRFLDQITEVSLANLSFRTGSYHRSAFHLDRSLAGLQGADYENLLNSMQKLYARLEEPDLVVGVAALRTQEPGLDSLVLYHQAVGNFQDALCCYERQRSGEGEVNYSGMIQCYLNIDQPAAAANLAAGQYASFFLRFLRLEQYPVPYCVADLVVILSYLTGTGNL